MDGRREKKRLDLLNLAYGVGAAIVIVGAMFKFLAWPLANEFFLVGLTTEAVVFLISGVEFKKKSPKRLKWERLFPQIDPNFQGEYEQIDLSQMYEIYFRNTKAIVESVESLNGNINKLNTATEKLTAGAEKLGENLERIDASTERYENQLDDLTHKMQELNAFYNRMNVVAAKNENDQ